MRDSVKGGATIWARQTLESEVFMLKPDKWFKLWFYLVNRANHHSTRLFPRGTNFENYRNMAQQTNSTEGQVEAFLRWAKQSVMITTRKTTRGFVFNIVNYEVYQDLDNYRNGTGNGTLNDLKTKHSRHYKQEWNNDKNKKDFLDKKSSLSNNHKPMRTYDENKHSDSDIPAVSFETGENLNPAPKKEAKNKTALRLQSYFMDECEKNTGTRPVRDGRGYFVMIDALKHLTEENIKTKIADWFGSGVPIEQMVSLTRCLSHNEINKFKVTSGIK